MTRNLFHFVLLLLLASPSLFAKIIEGKEAEKRIPGTTLIELNDETNLIKRIEFNTKMPFKLSGFDAWLLQFSQDFAPNTNFQLLKKEKDKEEFTHLSYTQHCQNYRIEYGILKVHANRQGIVYQINAELYPNLAQRSFADLASIDGMQAKAIAKTYFQNQKMEDENMRIELKEQLFFPVKKQDLTPCYKIDIYGHLPQPKRSYLYISAEDGAILFEEDRIEASNVVGTAVTKYAGNQQITTDSINPTTFYLRESGARNIHTWDLNQGTAVSSAVEFEDSNNFWNTSSNQDNAAYDAHWGAEKTWDYYSLIHGRNSYDNAGSVMNNYVHYGLNYLSSFWDGDAAFFGDGNLSNANTTAQTSLEIVGHEITHGVTEHTAGLIYSYESGALSESFSDIFGVTIDYFVNPSTANFLIGEQTHVWGQPIRNMQYPNGYGHPSTYLGNNWFTGSADNGGVHTNSGVQNYWYVLLCNGGTGVNDLGNSYNVTGLGMTKAAAIAYRTLTVYLTPNAQYADARIYSLQAAVDLYGPCSNEVTQVGNAWYAVGVGGVYSSDVIADFSADNRYFCTSPAGVQFTNLSTNATIYQWDFGDNTTSNLQNPTHTYTSVGTYTVKLIVAGNAFCTTNDTLIMPNYITVSNTPTPISATCTPVTNPGASNGYGVSLVQLHTINNPSLGAQEGYKDFTCSSGTILNIGSQYLLTLHTVSNNDNVRVWLDYDNNGSFSNNEQIADFLSGSSLHQSIISLPTSGVVLNTPLRLRVLSDANTILSPCQNPNYWGQAEDYRVTVETAVAAPIANFMMSAPIVSLGQTVVFTDLSTNTPTNWLWSMNGGTLSFPNNQNASAVFSTTGTYTIQLIATNSYGSDTFSQIIEVVNGTNLCTGGSSQTSNAAAGVLYDSGGLQGAYQSNENCTLFISPGSCVDSIRFTLTNLDTEPWGDYLRVYDGTPPNGILLLQASGTTLPLPVTAKSDSIFIEWSSNFNNNYSGFEAYWESYSHTSPSSSANFSFNPVNPPLLDTVFFQDLSVGSVSTWAWDFGDGQTSSLQNPKHVYALSGTYVVKLIVTACPTSDTFTQTISIQPSPNMIFSPSSFAVNLACNDTVTLPFYIQNTSGGTLHWNIEQEENMADMLIWTYGVNMSPNAGYQNMMQALNQYYTNYTYSTTATTNPAIMQGLLQGKTTLLIPSKGNGNISIIASFAPVIQAFVQNGGTVIVCGDNQLGTWSNIGIFTGPASGGVFVSNGNTLTLANNTSPITYNIGTPFQAVHATFGEEITNPNKTSLVSYQGFNGVTYDIVSYRQYGQGKAIYIGFDYSSYNNDAAKIIANSVAWSAYNSNQQNVTITANTGYLSAGNADTAYIQLNSNGLSGGLDTLYLVVQSNDVNHLTESIPIYLTISPLPCAYFGETFVGQCTGVVDFIDSTTNTPTSWLWDFGDGTTSTLQNPTHTYTSIGTYNVTLTASNAFGTNTITQTVSINNINLIANAACTPIALFQGSSSGIIKVELNTINYPSNNSIEGYQDLTCTQNTDLWLGSQYIFKINAAQYYDQLSAWIDYNNDGQLDNNEQIASFQGGNPSYISYQTIVTIPTTGVVTNTPLRLRVLSDNGNQISSSCQNPYYGQAEDYTVHLLPPSGPPIANFMIDDTLKAIGENIAFTDLSVNGPTNWAWSLVGGMANFSTSQNPNTSFLSPGVYTIQLIVSNSFGSDTISKSLTVLAGTSLCTLGNTQTTTADIGILYDSGGANGNYNISESCSLLISPGTCTDSISLSFLSFLTEPWVDNLQVYEGSSVNGTLLLDASGYVIPLSIMAHASAIFIKWNSDLTDNYAGFKAVWKAYQHVTLPPIANFSFTPNNIPLLDSVYFQNLSSNNANAWYWNFGDGHTSSLENPTHAYTLPGTYQVMLVAYSCGLMDTLTQTVTVQASPNLVFSPSSYTINLGCRDTVTLPFYIQNTSGGTLNWSANTITEVKNPLNVLIWTYGVDTTSGGEFDNITSAINQYVNNFLFTTTSTIVPSVMQALLKGKTTLVIPKNDTGIISVVSSFSNVIQAFVQNGGTVIVCGDLNINTWKRIGVFTGNVGFYLPIGTTFPVINTTSPLTYSVGTTIQSVNNVFYNVITNPNKQTIVSHTANGITYDIVTYLQYGQGKAIYIGYDFSTYNYDAARIVANAVDWSRVKSLTNNMSITPNTGTVVSGLVDTSYIQINSNGMNGGLDTFYIVLETNDLLHLSNKIPIYIQNTMAPCASFGYQLTSSCVGMVQFSDSSTNNPTNLLWKFGDGTTSTLQNPVHTYLLSGTYNITLIASNAFGIDSVTIPYTITNIGGPIAAVCTPTSSSNAYNGYGITNVTLNTIDNTTVAALEGYRDFTCDFNTTLMGGSQYTLKVTTSGNYNYTKAWIDYNDDGGFNNSEEIASYPIGNTFYQSNFIVPNANIIFNKALRLRVLADYVVLNSACQFPYYGQAEDYTVIIQDPIGIAADMPKLSGIEVYPIPFQSEFIIEFLQENPINDFELSISNTLGQIIYQNKYAAQDIINQHVVIPANFEAGIYNLEIKSKETYYLRKLIKE